MISKYNHGSSSECYLYSCCRTVINSMQNKDCKSVHLNFLMAFCVCKQNVLSEITFACTGYKFNSSWKGTYYANFWVHILFLVTTRAGLHAWCSKNSCFLIQTADCSSPVFSRIFASVWDGAVSISMAAPFIHSVTMWYYLRWKNIICLFLQSMASWNLNHNTI